MNGRGRERAALQHRPAVEPGRRVVAVGVRREAGAGREGDAVHSQTWPQCEGRRAGRAAASVHSCSLGRRRPAQRHQACASCALRCSTGAARSSRPSARTPTACQTVLERVVARQVTRQAVRQCALAPAPAGVAPLARVVVAAGSTNGSQSRQASGALSIVKPATSTSWAPSSLSKAKPPSSSPTRSVASATSTSWRTGTALRPRRAHRQPERLRHHQRRPRGASPRAAAPGGRSTARRRRARPGAAAPACARARGRA